MAAPKKAGSKRSSAPAPLVAPVVEEPVGRWAEVLAEAQNTPGVAIEPFQVTKDLVIQPLTPTRSRALSAAQNAYFAALGATANAAQFGATKEQVEEIQKWIDESLTAYNVALFGRDEYPRVVAYFANQDEWKQGVFTEAVKRQFLRLPDDDGKCPTCSHNPIEAEQQIAQLRQALTVQQGVAPTSETGGDGPAVGKEDGSSTTSSTTGTNSSETSPQSSTESTPGTGSEDLAPGHSSSSTQTASHA